jgi:TPR repeat protein
MAYRDGKGVAADPARAMKLFAEGAEKGHAESILLYAQGIETGVGGVASPTKAISWYQQAAAAGNAEAVNWCRRRGVAF